MHRQDVFANGVVISHATANILKACPASKLNADLIKSRALLIFIDCRE